MTRYVVKYDGRRVLETTDRAKAYKRADRYAPKSRVRVLTISPEMTR